MSPRERLITEAELRRALDFVAGERVPVPHRGIVLGLIRAGLVVEERVGVGGMGRKLSLTPRGTVERISRMSA